MRLQHVISEGLKFPTMEEIASAHADRIVSALKANGWKLFGKPKREKTLVKGIEGRNVYLTIRSHNCVSVVAKCEGSGTFSSGCFSAGIEDVDGSMERIMDMIDLTFRASKLVGTTVRIVEYEQGSLQISAEVHGRHIIVKTDASLKEFDVDVEGYSNPYLGIDATELSDLIAILDGMRIRTSYRRD
jgi:hypothetical protein